MHIGLVGAGASSVYLLSKIFKDIKANGKPNDIEISIFEKGAELGKGMPYDAKHVDRIHVVNILPEETPELLIGFEDWLKKQSDAKLAELGINRDEIHSKRIFQRIAMGHYLKAQYDEIVGLLRAESIKINEHPNTVVVDAIDNPNHNNVSIHCENGTQHTVDKMVIATGHLWPELNTNSRKLECPWPIDKIMPQNGEQFNFPVGILGASLSAFDVVASLAEKHGHFERNGEKLIYKPDPGTENFRLVLHTSRGNLPHIRCAFQSPRLQQYRQFSREEIEQFIVKKGQLTLEDYFQHFCKPSLLEDLRSNGLHNIADQVEQKSMTFKGFLELMTAQRRYDDPFEGMKKELAEAKKSVEADRPVYWKETFDELMYTLNDYTAQLNAEDLLFYKQRIMPFTSNLIAFLPHESAEKLLALREADKVSVQKGRVVAASEENPGCKYVTVVRVDPEKGETAEHYQRFIDCSGQKTASIIQFPMPTLVKQGVVCEPEVAFNSQEIAQIHVERSPQEVRQTASGKYVYLPGGLAIDNNYHVIGKNAQPNPRIYDVAYPHVKGQRPYFAGLAQCSDLSEIVATELMNEARLQSQGSHMGRLVNPRQASEIFPSARDKPQDKRASGI